MLSDTLGLFWDLLELGRHGGCVGDDNGAAHDGMDATEVGILSGREAGQREGVIGRHDT